MFGPHQISDGTVEFRLWAPSCQSVELCLDNRPALPMISREKGWFSASVSASPGDRYQFRLPNGELRPDPGSRFQPLGVHGPSEVVSLRPAPGDWKGVEREDLIIYELHVGTFTEEGSYEAAMERLPELVDLGITAIELMPLAQAGGNWNWGYDGVNLFAPSQAYGSPGYLTNLIDAAHGQGMAVVLDVVYNHYGPEGNYLGEFGGYVSKKHRTPWGDAPNYDGRGGRHLRDYILENMRYWIEDYGFDGLRVDAIHYILDNSTPHFVREMGEMFAALRSRLKRPIHLIAESNIYDPELLTPLDQPSPGDGIGFDALWCDDFVHAIHAIIDPELHMSERRYQDTDLSLVLQRGYVYQGTFTTERVRHSLEDRWEPIELQRQVIAMQHHDYIGNHPLGSRIHHIAGVEAQRAVAALLLLSPSIPMLFMGEEFSTDSPFCFFVDFEDSGLRRGVEKGRRAEHPQHVWDSDDAVSPISPEAFLRSKIGSAADGNAQTRDWYRDLIRLRKEWQASGLLRVPTFDAEWDEEMELAIMIWDVGAASAFVVVRLHQPSSPVVDVPVAVEGEVLLSTGDVAPWGPENHLFQLGAFAVLIGKGKAGVTR